jgi:hypothetical protein
VARSEIIGKRERVLLGLLVDGALKSVELRHLCHRLAAEGEEGRRGDADRQLKLQTFGNERPRDHGDLPVKAGMAPHQGRQDCPDAPFARAYAGRRFDSNGFRARGRLYTLLCLLRWNFFWVLRATNEVTRAATAGDCGIRVSPVLAADGAAPRTAFNDSASVHEFV